MFVWPRHSEELAHEVKMALDRKRWSTRDVARATGNRISHMTVWTMIDGNVPQVHNLILVAQALGIDPNRWLKLLNLPLRYTGEDVRQEEQGDPHLEGSSLPDTPCSSHCGCVTAGSRRTVLRHPRVVIPA